MTKFTTAELRGFQQVCTAEGAMVAIACFADGKPMQSAGTVAVPGGAIAFGDCADLTGATFHRWCAEAGFARCDVLRLTDVASATIAYK